MASREGGPPWRTSLGGAAVSLWVVAGLILGGGCNYFRGGNSEWTPTDSTLADGGPEVARRFGLERWLEVSVQVNNAFLPSNRAAMARAEAALARIPGVRSALGPAGLRVFELDAGGQIAALPLLGAGGTAADAQVAEPRARVARRADAMGWFISRDGTEIRFLVETDAPARVRAGIAAAIAAAGLTRLGGDEVPITPLLSSPGRDPTPYRPVVLLGVLLGLASLFVVPALHGARPGRSRALLAALTAGLAAASLGVFAPVVPLRRSAAAAGLAVVVWIVLVAIAMRGKRPRPGRGTPPGAVRFAVPVWVGIPCAALVIVLLAAWPRLGLATRLWQSSSLFFIRVRGALDQPVVMREVRRVTDFVREQPGVAGAWSIADTVDATVWTGRDRAGIPDDEPALRELLSRALADPAGRLELAADHREGLVVIRWDDSAGIDRVTLQRRIERYLETGQRSLVARVDLDDPDLSLAARGFARGVLAADGGTRILRMCARSGRNLDDDARAATRRAARQAALGPSVELPRLRAEVADEVLALVRRLVLPARERSGRSRKSSAPRGSASSPALDRPASVLPSSAVPSRLTDALAAEPWQSSPADIAALVAAGAAGKDVERALGGHLPELRARLLAARRHNAGRPLVRELLGALDLPLEGTLSEQIRDALLETMGPIVGIPLTVGGDGSYRLESLVVGGVAQDVELSRTWLPRMWLGVAASSLLIAVVLLLLGGAAALAWWPVALGPLAAVLAAPAIAAVSIGIWPMVVAAGALAGGAAFAVVFAPAWSDP